MVIKLKKDEIIERYGEEEYKKRLTQHRAKRAAHLVEARKSDRAWRDEHPEKVMEYRKQQSRRIGKYYARKVEYMRTGLQGERNKIRLKHRNGYRLYKQIIAPESQLHHSWRRGSAKYDGLALVEADAHMHGFIDVIQILEGEIKLFAEAEIREQ